MNFNYPIDIEDRFRFEHEERRETEERLNLYYSTKVQQSEVITEQQVWNTNVIGHRYKFLPFRIYSFDYIYPNDSKLRKSIDIRPLVFITEEYEIEGESRVKGFNLNYLPKKVKVHFMQGYMHYFGPAINEDLEKLKYNNPDFYKFTDRDIKSFMGMVETQFPKILNSSRTWRKGQIPPSSVKVVKISDYDKIFEYTGYEKTIKGKSWRQLQYETVI